MIDFHTHILPSIDDGSESESESLEMLKILYSQGIRTVFATPHFYPHKDTPESFLRKRTEAYERIKESIKEGMPQLRLGAEIAYYSGVSRMAELLDMRLGGTKLLLLEMPEERWTDYTIQEILSLACSSEIIPVIAHSERCKRFQQSSVMEQLFSEGVLSQANASYILTKKTKRQAFKEIKKGRIHLIGSDCHGVEFRPPKIGDAYGCIEKKFGKDFLADFSMRSYELIK